MKYRKQYAGILLAIHMITGMVSPVWAGSVEMGSPLTSEVGAAAEPEKPEGEKESYISNLLINDYQILSTTGKEKSKIEKGNKVSIAITLIDTGIPSEALETVDNIDVVKIRGSFSGEGKIYKELLSDNGQTLSVKITIQELVYDGVGNRLPIQIGYKNLGLPYGSCDLEIAECSEYKTPTVSPVPSPEKPEVSDVEVENEKVSTGDVPEPESISMGTPVNAEMNTPIDGPVPNIIISRFTYGEEPRVPIGSAFDLAFDFINTSKNKNIENMIVSVEPADGAILQSSTNTFYYEALGAKKQQTSSVGMQVQPDTKQTAVTVEVNFKYEYVDNNKRTAVTLPGKISVPVYQPDRLQISAPAIPEEASVGEEISLSMNYVNKGKGEAANVEATIEGNVDSTLKQQNLGNFEAGKSGTIDFVVTPKNEGEVSFVLKIAYEDENMKVKTKEFPVTLQVKAEKPKIDEMGMEGMGDYAEEKQVPWKLPAFAVFLIIAGGVVFKIRRRKKETAEVTDDWDLEEDEEKW